MSMTPERVAERVEGLIESIGHGLSHSFAEQNAVLTISYIRQLLDLGIISAAQFHAIVRAVNQAAHGSRPTVEKNGPLPED